MALVKDWEKTYTKAVAERSTCVFQSGQFTDEAGVAVAKADLGTVKLWLYVKQEAPGAPSAYLNSRNGVSIKDANGGTITTGGVLTLVLDPADNVISESNLVEEWHTAEIEYTYNGGAKTGRVLWHFPVVNIPVPV